MYSGFQGYQRTDNNVFLNLRNLKITGIYVYMGEMELFSILKTCTGFADGANPPQKK